MIVKVPDSIEVVRNILSELEADAEDRPETEEEEGDEDEVDGKLLLLKSSVTPIEFTLLVPIILSIFICV